MLHIDLIVALDARCWVTGAQTRRPHHGVILNFRWALYYGPLWLIIVLVSFIMLTVYRSVRNEAMAHKNRVDGKERRSSFIKKPSSWRDMKPSSFIKRHKKPHGFLQERHPEHQGKHGHLHGSSNSLVLSRLNRIEESSQADAEVNDIDHVISAIEKLPSATHQTMDVHQFASKIVFWQSVMYTFAFYITFTFATINRLVFQVTGKTYFALLFLHVLLMPLQGFFNVMIYRYGFYLRLKQRHPEMSHWELYHHTYRWTFMGPPPGSATLRSTVYDSHNSVRGGPARIAPEIGGSKGEVATSGELHDSIILEEIDGHEESDEDLDVVLKDIVTDMIYSYSEYPNLVSNDDIVLPAVSTFPKMVDEFSTTSFPPFDPYMVPAAP
jgi:hypothetical protein